MDRSERYQGSPSRWCHPVSNSCQTYRVKLIVVNSSDFEDKFVCGEIMAYDDLKEYGTEAAVKAAGKLRQQGKPYEIVDGDICYWKSGA